MLATAWLFLVGLSSPYTFCFRNEFLPGPKRQFFVRHMERGKAAKLPTPLSMAPPIFLLALLAAIANELARSTPFWNAT